MKRLAICAAAAIAVVAACSKSTAPGGGSPALPVPLAVGNWWAYVKSDSTRDTTRVLSETTYGGYTAYLVADPAWADTEIYYYDDTFLNDVVFYMFGFTNGDTIVINATKRALTAGDSWVSFDTTVAESLDADGILDTIRVHMTTAVEATEDVTVPAGTFTTFRLLFTDSTATWTSMMDTTISVVTTYKYWLAPGTGIVRDSFATGATRRLEGYSLN